MTEETKTLLTITRHIALVRQALHRVADGGG